MESQIYLKMKLSELCDIRYNFPNADFWIIAKGSENKLGMPVEDTEDYQNKIGIKVKDEALDILYPKYLYYIFSHLYSEKYWQKNSLIYGSLNLKNLRVEDVKNLRIG